MKFTFEKKDCIKVITNFFSVSIILTVIISILYLWSSGITGIIKMTFWSFLFILGILYVNNECLFMQFEENKIPGEYPYDTKSISKINALSITK